MRNEKWYQKKRLTEYFAEHYERYEDTAEFWKDPAPNQWLFDFPELGVKIELTCDEEGNVTEEQYPILK